MHSDEAVQINAQDLRSSAPAAHHSAAMDLRRAYFSPLRWYVQDGRTPAGDVTETGHLPRPRFPAESAAPVIDPALLPLAIGAER